MSGRSPYEELPSDAERIRKIGSYNIYYAPSDQRIYVIVTDYHPEALKLSRDVLLELAGLIW